MIPIYQKTDHDCFNACVASIFEIPIEDTPDASFVLEEDRVHWDAAWSAFFQRWGVTLLCVDYQGSIQADAGGLNLEGYAIANVKGWRGRNHAIVIRDGIQVFDPWPDSQDVYPKSRWQHVEFFRVLDPSKLTQQ
jgi:hypothetical protein